MDDEEESPPPKRRRRVNQETQGPEVIIRLLDADASELGLSHPIVIEFERLEYLTFNHDKVSYLYLICAEIFDVENSKITLNHVPSVESIDDCDDDAMIDWPLVEDDDTIVGGTYCIVFDSDAGNFNIIAL
jgi:hypothetical protein